MLKLLFFFIEYHYPYSLGSNWEGDYHPYGPICDGGPVKITVKPYRIDLANSQKVYGSTYELSFTVIPVTAAPTDSPTAQPTTLADNIDHGAGPIP